MWDSGLPDALKENPVETDKYKMWVERTLESQLEDIGVPAADVEYLILSHSHLDHAGNAALFENSTWIVDAAEVEFAESDFAKNLGIASPFEDPGTELQLISSDQDLFGDGVVRLVQTPGHTGGHISLLLTLENAGPLIFTGDLYHFPESRKKRLIPDINLDDEQTRASMEKFEKTVEETGARVVIQHSPEDFESMPKFPAYLD
jgi:glyoxylase-like metal-dependent hydrolase (beta-lactamase superfamily II)